MHQSLYHLTANLSEDLLALARHLRIAYHFRNSRRPGNKHPFKPKSQWIPPKANKILEDYIEATIAEEPEERCKMPWSFIA